MADNVEVKGNIHSSKGSNSVGDIGDDLDMEILRKNSSKGSNSKSQTDQKVDSSEKESVSASSKGGGLSFNSGDEVGEVAILKTPTVKNVDNSEKRPDSSDSRDPPACDDVDANLPSSGKSFEKEPGLRDGSIPSCVCGDDVDDNLPSSVESEKITKSETRNKTPKSRTFDDDKNYSPLTEDIMAQSESRRRRISTPSELRRHLDKKEQEEENKKTKEKKKREEEVSKIKKALQGEKAREGIQVLPGSRDSRKVIQAFLSEEGLLALEQEQELLDIETEDMKSEIREKYGTTKAKDNGLVAMAAEFYSSQEMPNEILPDRIRRNLTTNEIRDLKLVFDMFDVKGRGYIISYDLKRAAGMLGFRAKKQVFKEMIDELAMEQRGKVTFMNFLDFIVKSQGEGPDPYEEIVQCFRLMDRENKGFLTLNDLHRASDHAHLRLSNHSLAEMVQEADLTGDGRVTEVEFVRVMMQTNTFKLTSKGRTRLK